MKNLKELIKAIKENSRIENDRIILGEILELHITEDGENLDIYKYTDLDNVDEDYDFDDDYITSIYLK